MLQLKSLQSQLEALRMVYDTSVKHGKTAEEVQETYIQIKKIEKLIYERKIILKKEGGYEETR